jgi:hypothetical protein
MAMIRKWVQRAGAFGFVLFVSGAAAAKEELILSNVRYVNQVSALICEDMDESWQDAECSGAQMRLRLCQRGLDADPVVSPVVYPCVLRSQ